MRLLGTVRRVPASLRLLTLSTACIAVLTAEQVDAELRARATEVLAAQPAPGSMPTTHP